LFICCVDGESLVPASPASCGGVEYTSVAARGASALEIVAVPLLAVIAVASRGPGADAAAGHGVCGCGWFCNTACVALACEGAAVGVVAVAAVAWRGVLVALAATAAVCLCVWRDRGGLLR
jgi:hypothetical protein